MSRCVCFRPPRSIPVCRHSNHQLLNVDHCVQLTGFNTTGPVPYWVSLHCASIPACCQLTDPSACALQIVRNSWGMSWGANQGLAAMLASALRCADLELFIRLHLPGDEQQEHVRRRQHRHDHHHLMRTASGPACLPLFHCSWAWALTVCFLFLASSCIFPRSLDRV